jgi:hypothetical protein
MRLTQDFVYFIKNFNSQSNYYTKKNSEKKVIFNNFLNAVLKQTFYSKLSSRFSGCVGEINSVEGYDSKFFLELSSNN